MEFHNKGKTFSVVCVAFFFVKNFWQYDLNDNNNYCYGNIFNLWKIGLTTS